MTDSYNLNSTKAGANFVLIHLASVCVHMHTYICVFFWLIEYLGS